MVVCGCRLDLSFCGVGLVGLVIILVARVVAIPILMAVVLGCECLFGLPVLAG